MRRFACVGVGAVIGVVLAMVMAAAYARSATYLDPDPGPDLLSPGWTEPETLMLLSAEGGIWTVGVNRIAYSRAQSEPASADWQRVGFGAPKFAVVDAYDSSLWLMTTRNVLLKFDTAAVLREARWVPTGTTALAVGLDQRPWIVTPAALLRLSEEGFADFRIDIQPNIRIDHMLVDSLRDRIILASEDALSIVTIGGSEPVVRTDIAAGEAIRSIAVDPLSGQLWLLHSDRIYRYSSAGGFIEGIDLPHDRDGSGFVSIGYDGDLDVIVAAGSAQAVAFDRLGQWRRDLDVSALNSLVRPAPFRLLPTVEVIDTLSDAGVGIHVGAHCNRRVCEAGSRYTEGIRVHLLADGTPSLAKGSVDPVSGFGFLEVDRGVHRSLTFLAVDVFGHPGEPSTLSLTEPTLSPIVKANQAPSVALTAPPGNSTFVPGSTITLTASASDSDGTVTKVDFFRSGTLIGTATAPPWSSTWTNVPAGSYTLTAKATDDKGATKTSANVSITVKAPPNVAPSLSITGPVAGSTVNGPAITIASTAQDSDGIVSRIDYYEGTKLLATVPGVTATLIASWSYRDVAPGVHTIIAVATDNSGATATASVTFTVNAAPWAVITSPSPCGELISPTSITLTADAYDRDGSIARVDFYRGATLLGSASAPPYRYVWVGPPLGEYSFTAVAIDAQGATGTSNPVAVAIRTANVLPTVSITSPSSGERFGSRVAIAVSAAASDRDGTIRKVEFFSGTSSIGSRTTPPYATAWTPASVGNFVLTAKATDDRGSTTTSSPVTLSVVENISPSVSMQGPPNWSVLAAGETIDLEATASDSDGVVRMVEFLVYDEAAMSVRLVGIARTAPYKIPFTMDRAGAHYRVSARATDDLGATSTSYSVALLGNTPPTVTITSPQDGSFFLPGSPVTITATYFDYENNFKTAIAEAWTNGRLLWKNQALRYNTDTHGITFGRVDVHPGEDMTLVVRIWDSKDASSYSLPVHYRTAPAPSIELVTPRDGDSILTPNSVRITAKASQPLGGIVRVNYYSEGNLIGTSTTPPYELIWRPPFSGSTTKTNVRAEAIDNLGTGGVGTTDSASILVEPLRLTITSPAQQDPFINDSTFTVTGTYSDGVPSSIKVNGVSATFANGTYQAQISLGDYTFEAKTIRVVAATPTGDAVREVPVLLRRPQVVLNSPATGNYLAPFSLDLAITTYHFARGIKRVEYLADANVIATAFSPPWRAAWEASTPATFGVSARVIDEKDNVYTSSSTWVGIRYGVGAFIVSPADESTFAQGVPILLTAYLRPAEGMRIVRMELLMDEAVVASNEGTWGDLAWQFTVLNMPVGRHALAVRITDSSGAAVTSEPLRTRIVPGPSLSLAVPRPDSSYRTGSTVRLAANLAKAGVSIGLVDFFANDLHIARVWDSPFVFDWQDVPAGTYQLTARVKDPQSREFTSQPVAITVGPVALNIDQPSDQETIYEPWVVVGGNFDSAGAPQSIVVNGISAVMGKGIYAARVPVNIGSNVITVAGTFGAQSAHRSIVVNRAEPSITFANIRSGDLIHNDTVPIRGIVRGPRNSALHVNGQPTALSPTGEFFINSVPLNIGSNAIVFRLMKQDDTFVEWRLAVTRDGIKPFVLSVTPATGYSLPLPSLLSVRRRYAVDYTTLQLLDGGRVVFEEIVSGDKTERQYLLEVHEYTTADLAIRLLDSRGETVFTEALSVRASRPEDLDAAIRAFYLDTLFRIAAGDLTGGASAYLPQLQADYRTMYEELGADASAFAEMMRNIGSVTFAEESAEIVVHQAEAAGLRGYPVGLMKDSKGIWRITGM